MRVRVTTEAYLDLDEGYDFYEKQSPSLGGRFLESLLADIETLNAVGGIHEVFYRHHRMYAKRYPYTIHYKVRDQLVIVTAVLDARRHPGWILDRLN